MTTTFFEVRWTENGHLHAQRYEMDEANTALLRHERLKDANKSPRIVMVSEREAHPVAVEPMSTLLRRHG